MTRLVNRIVYSPTGERIAGAIVAAALAVGLMFGVALAADTVTGTTVELDGEEAGIYRDHNGICMKSYTYWRWGRLQYVSEPYAYCWAYGI